MSVRSVLLQNYYYNDKKTEQKVEKTEYHNVVVWGNLAVLANQLLSKGSKSLRRRRSDNLGNGTQRMERRRIEQKSFARTS